ncbi:MAG TPA: hypothetical protein VFI42_20890 [Thermomicrobiaceae bacterium]|nr:hypothetical protein [Thermomicrobiaceae bacterium]
MIALAIALLLLWLLLSAVCQLKLPLVSVIRRRDVFSLIPNWSFFAPRPGTNDYHLLFRDCDEVGEFRLWQEIPLADSRTLWGAIWNPQKRNKKALSDTVRSLLQISTSPSPGSVYLTIPYLATLNYISSLPRARSSVATQFMILQSDGFISAQDPQLVFISNVHRI